MPRTAGNRFGPRQIFTIVFLAVMAIYLWGTFTAPGTGTCTAADVLDENYDCTAAGQEYETTDFVIPESEQIEGSALWIIKLFIVGVAVFMSYILVLRFVGGRPSRRDMVSLIVLMLIVFVVYTYIIGPTNILGASSFGQLTLDKIGHKTALMIGVK